MASIKDIQYVTPPQPRQLRLDTTTTCNASCLSCHRFNSGRQGEMPYSLIEKLLSDVSKWATPLEEIIPVNYGEFFTRKDWYGILVMIAQYLPYTQIVIPTNGSFLSNEAIFKIAKIPTVKIMNYSVNAYFDETYKQFTGLNPDVIPMIRKGVAQLKVLRPDITHRVSMVFDPEYQTDLERDLFKNYWIGHAEPWILPAASAGRTGKKPVNPVKLPCRSIFSDIVVGYDGKISSCCFDPAFNAFELGYYSGDLLRDWHSPELTELRRLHNEEKRTEVALCKACTFS